jgi:hypothetical protein
MRDIVVKLKGTLHKLRIIARKGRQAVTQNNQIRGTLTKFGVQERKCEVK